ncbi:MAG TPA: mechanosensitive ion channel [Chloroflexota bacterium]
MPAFLEGIFTANVVSRVIGAVLILIIGWIIARIISGIVRGVLRRLNANNRINRATPGTTGGGIDVEGLVGGAVYWLILLFAIVSALDLLSLTIITSPLTAFLSLVLLWIPRIIAAAILIVIAWIVARIVRTLVVEALRSSGLENRLMRSATSATSEAAPAPSTGGLAQTLGEVVYWLIWLIFLPGILNALGLEGLLIPVQGLLNEILLFLPLLISAGAILLVGYFVARIVQRIVTDLLAASGVDRLSARVGLGSASGGPSISSLLGMIVFVLIFIPVLTSALGTLGLVSVALPLSNMLNLLLAALPAIFAALVLLWVTYFVGRILADIVAGVLAGAGFNILLARLGLVREPAVGQTSPSQVVGGLVFAFLMIGAAMEAAQIIGFALLATLLTGLIIFGTRLVMALIIFAVGMSLANAAYRSIMSSAIQQAGLLALAARISILILASALALRETDLANDIVNLAFGLLLGAIAVAVAIAFGLGGRDVARQELEEWRAEARTRQIPPGPAGGVGPGGMMPRGDIIPPGQSQPPGGGAG